jgi:hypothetical protein
MTYSTRFITRLARQYNVPASRIREILAAPLDRTPVKTTVEPAASPYFEVAVEIVRDDAARKLAFHHANVEFHASLPSVNPDDSFELSPVPLGWDAID